MVKKSLRALLWGTVFLATAYCASASSEALTASRPVAAPTPGIYWSDPGAGTIKSARLDGTGIKTLIAGQPGPNGIVIAGDHLIWADAVNDEVLQANSDGSNMQVLVSTGSSRPRDVSVTAAYLYYTTTFIDSISRAPIDGGSPTALVTTGLSFPNGIFVTSSSIYWSDSGTPGIWRSDLNGGNVTLLVKLPDTGTQIPNDVFVTEKYLYYSTRDIALTQGGTPQPGTIQRAKLDGSGATVLVDSLVFPQQVFVTKANLYWADQNTGKIQRSKLDGTGVIDLVTGLTQPVGLAVVTGKGGR